MFSCIINEGGWSGVWEDVCNVETKYNTILNVQQSMSNRETSEQYEDDGRENEKRLACVLDENGVPISKKNY